MKKFNYEEIVETIKENCPVNNCITVGFCHPNTYQALFGGSFKKSIITNDIVFYPIEDDTLLKEDILFMTHISTTDSIEYEDKTIPQTGTTIIPLVPIEE